MPTPGRSLVCCSLVAAVIALAAWGGPTELGFVTWGRDLDVAFERAARESKPVFLLFQEVPGCQGCQDFGTGPLSHPLVVEAIEDLFVPVVVNNRGGGADEAVLARFEEPKLNYPVIRFVDETGRDVIPRRERVWSVADVATRMLAALEAAGRSGPAYLRVVAEESGADRRSTATFAMHCFWVGEGRLGRLDGVVATEAGWVGGREVVTVTFDPARIRYADLVRAAMREDCATHVFTHDAAQDRQAASIDDLPHSRLASAPRPASDGDRKYALRRTRLRHLPLTPMQATKMNSALRAGEDPRIWLSPRQLELYGAILQLTDAQVVRLETLHHPADVADLRHYEEQLRQRLAGDGS